MFGVILRFREQLVAVSGDINSSWKRICKRKIFKCKVFGRRIRRKSSEWWIGLFKILRTWIAFLFLDLWPLYIVSDYRHYFCRHISRRLWRIFLSAVEKVKSNGGYQSRFIRAKSRVAPLKELTIPRLELKAAVLESPLYKTIIEECRLQFENVIFIRDSMIVLT